MKPLIILYALSLISCQAAPLPVVYTPQHGDLVFQSLPCNPIIDAIEGCTGSPYSHCGIVIHHEGGWHVLEAIGPVKETPLKNWIAQSSISKGRRDHFAVCRLKPEFQKHIPSMIAGARRFIGKPYDIQYELDDEKIYCSELIYKGWQAATTHPLGKLCRLSDLNWQPYETVIRSITGGRLPLDRQMITPKNLAAAPQLDPILPYSAHSLSQ